MNTTCGGIDASPLNITVLYFGTAFDVIREAAIQGTEYLFTASYSEEREPGYTIDIINGRGRSTEPSCRWVFYVQSPDGIRIKPTQKISTYIPGQNFQIIMSYEEFSVTSVITTDYTIEYPDPTCVQRTPPDSVRVTTPIGSTAINVMEQAVAQYGQSYRFSAIYGGSMNNYRINQLNDVATNGSCSWFAFVMTPNGGGRTPISVFLHALQENEMSSLILRFQEPEVPATTTDSGAKVKMIITGRDCCFVIEYKAKLALY